MAVRVFCSQPQELLIEIKAAIGVGTVQTWALDSDGDFTHSPEQWKNKAWFRPEVQTDRIIFKILGRKTKRMTKGEYAVYHGRFIEMLLSHFDSKFTAAVATAYPSDGDWIGQPS
jgi:hypothetical protein